MAALIGNEVGLPFSNMEKSQTPGRILVAISLIVFGIQHFMYGGFVAGLVPAFMPGRLFWAYFIGAAFVAAAAGILYKMLARPAATMLGVMFFLFVLLLHIPRIVLHSRDGVLFLNPGSAGPRRFTLPVSVALLSLGAKRPRARLVTLL